MLPEFLLAAYVLAPPQGQAAVPAQPGHAPAPCAVAGVITSGTIPLPGVAITIRAGDRVVAASSSGPDGTYRVRLPSPDGQYELRAELTAFAPATATVALNAADCQARLDVQLTLASRAAAAAAPASGQPATSNAAKSSTPPGATGPAARSGSASTGRNRNGGRPFQPLGLQADSAGLGAADENAAGAGREESALPAGFSTDMAGESVVSVGATGQLNSPLLAERFAGREAGDLAGGDSFRADAGANGQGGPGGRAGFGGGGFGPGGFGQGGFGQGGGPGGFAFGGRMRNEQIRGLLSMTFAGSPFDSAPYSLTGQPTDKPEYFQQRYTFTLGGPLKIPGVWKGDSKTSFVFNYNGNHSDSPLDIFSTVPTSAARTGDFSSLSTPIIDPETGQPFPGNLIPASRIDPSAASLLAYIPAANQPGARQNYRFTSASAVNSDDVNLRITHAFGQNNQQQRQGGQPRGGGGVGGRGGGGRGGTNLSIGIHYRHADSDQTTAFSTLAGASAASSWDVPVGLTFAHDNFFHTIRLQFNRSRSAIRNLYAGVTNVTGDAGIGGVSTDPFDWGVPSLSFTTISSLRDITPSNRLDRTIGISYSVVTTRHRHTLRGGGDVRFLATDSRLDRNANGSFTFTGIYTGAPAGTGPDFADFLLGLPQAATLQFGPATERYRERTMDLYFQDDWRLKNNLTFNLGVRYEYFAPYTELSNRLVTLDVNQDFTQAVPVESGGTGPFTGEFPASLVTPDRNNVAPRLGLAWKPTEKWTLRAGYGVNFIVGAYLPIAQQLASQPPFATASTVFGTPEDAIRLATVFTEAPLLETQNTYGIDPAFRLGYAHIWNVDVQREMSRTLVVGASYTGTRGGDLDVQRAPNRGPDGPTIPDVPPFIWEASPGYSRMNSLSLRFRKRQTHGIAFGATYTLSKSMDDASTIGGGIVVVAQNDKDLAAEWGLSSFDQRHRFNADASYELPFGPDRRWLKTGFWSAIAGGWMWSGNVQLASGTPFTARIIGDVTNVAQGTNGSLRADYNGAPITLDDKTVLEYFNTAAFSGPPPGQFGNAARNTIPGPGTTNANMALTRNVTFAGTRGLSIRVQANNVFNIVQFVTIDTVVNSPTFGHVIAARPMRSVQIVARVRF